MNPLLCVCVSSLCNTFTQARKREDDEQDAMRSGTAPPPAAASRRRATVEQLVFFGALALPKPRPKSGESCPSDRESRLGRVSRCLLAGWGGDWGRGCVYRGAGADLGFLLESGASSQWGDD